MLYDNDDYLNGLESNPGWFVHYPEPDGEYYLFEPIPGLICEKDSTDILCNQPLPPHYHIFKAWHDAKQDCNLRNEDISIYPNNECLNKRFGRLDEVVGEKNCKLQHIWRLEVKSRPCMIKNANPEEIDLYQICGADEAFLCTKISIIEKQRVDDADRIAHAKFREEIAAREETRKLYFSDLRNVAADRWTTRELSTAIRCDMQGECSDYFPKNDGQCNIYNILGNEVKSKLCMQKYATQKELNLYEDCGNYGHFICIKGAFKHQWVIDYIKSKKKQL